LRESKNTLVFDVFNKNFGGGGCFRDGWQLEAHNFLKHFVISN